VPGLSNFLTLQTFEARQNHLLRTNKTRIRPLSFTGVPWNGFCLPARDAGTKFVSQGAALFAGPEAFSFYRPIRRTKNCNQLSVLNSAHTKIAPATLAESALPFLLDLKVFGISTYKKNRGALVMNQNRRPGNGLVVAQVAPPMISDQRDLRLLSCEGAYFLSCPSPLECALTQKQGRGYRTTKADPSRFGARDDSVAKRRRDRGSEGPRSRRT
jgi:hypothetical protein